MNANSQHRHPRVPLPVAALLSAGLAAGGLVSSPAVAAAAPTCAGEEATIVGTSGPDHLAGTPGRDVIVGLGGRDVIRGRGGDDLICGGRGADTLFGGPGDDELYGGLDSRGADRAGVFLVGDLLRGGPGDDLLDLGADDRRGHKPPDTVAYDKSHHPVVVDLSAAGNGIATGEGTDVIVRSTQTGVVGSSYADTIIGSPADDQLVGGGGDDTVSGGPGDDFLSGDVSLGRDGALGGGPVGTASDDDVVHGDSGDDYLVSGRGHDQLFGDDGRDGVEVTGTEATEVHGGAGLDNIGLELPTEAGGISDGGPGFDYLTVYGSAYQGTMPRARYTLDLRTGTSSVSSDPTVTGAVGGYEEYRLQARMSWRFFGTPGDDRVRVVSGGPLRATTYAGDDQMIGTSRVDHLNGGPGTDTADGREGNDICLNIEKGNRTC